MVIDYDELVAKLIKKIDFDVLVEIIADHNIPRDVALSIAIDFFKCPDDALDD